MMAQAVNSAFAALRASQQMRMEAERGYRYSWWTHWARCAEFYYPRRYRWFVTPNQYNRGSAMNQAIIDETALLARRTCATGLMAGLTSPTKPWFRVGLHGIPDFPSGPVREWCALVERRALKLLSQSNFYQAIGTVYDDMTAFGSAAMIQFEDYEDVVRFINPCAGEYFFVLDNKLQVGTLMREYTYTISQVVEEFGIENCSEDIIGAAKSGGGSLSREVVISHVIGPNKPFSYAGDKYPAPVPSVNDYFEAFWVQGSQSDKLLRLRGFRECPFVGARWNVSSNDAYGSGPGFDGLPATIQLQIEQRRKGEGIDKQVRPPMVASMGMKNEPSSTLPGGITYVPNPQGEGFKPAYTVQPDLQYLISDIKEVQARIDMFFFVPLFMMISSLETTGRTATEIDARRQEGMTQVGPVIERFQKEVLDPTLHRTISIMARRGLLPPAPPEIRGMEINIQYISPLAQAQRAASTAGIERLTAFVGGIGGAIPEAFDKIDFDAAIDIYGDDLDVDPRIIRSEDAVEAIRAARAQAQQQQQQLQTGTALAQGANTLSKTEVGGGKNALEAMLG